MSGMSPEPDDDIVVCLVCGMIMSPEEFAQPHDPQCPHADDAE